MGAASINYRGMDMEVEYFSTPFSPEVRTMSNGDPGWPAEGGEFYVESVKVCGVDITELISEEELERIGEIILKQSK